MLLFTAIIVLISSLNCVALPDFFEIDAVVGRSAELPCNVTAEALNDKLNILAWYRNGSSAAFFSRDLRNGENFTEEITPEEQQEGRFELTANDEEGISSLRILVANPSDAGLYYCFADFASSPAHKTFIKLNVVEPPKLLWVIHENGTRVATASPGSNASENIGPYYIGDRVRLFCVAFGGTPLATLTWSAENRQLKDTSTRLSEHRVRSDLEHGPLRREDHGSVLSCMASNNAETPPLAIDVIISMHLPPELVSVRDMTSQDGLTTAAGRVHSGQTMRLQCRVLGARPSPPIQWLLNNQHLNATQNIVREPSQRLIISEIDLLVNEEYDESQVTCCAPANQREDRAVICAQPMPLAILYQPVLELIVPGKLENDTLFAVKGSNLQLNCSYRANPSIFQIMWFHEDDVIIQGDEEMAVRPTLELTNITEHDSGEYVCAASNDEGSAYSEALVLNVTYSPYCTLESIVEYGVAENENINITCHVKGNPAPHRYKWALINEALESKFYQETIPHQKFETVENVFQYQRPNGTPFTTIFCWGFNGVMEEGQRSEPCSFLITDETAPRPPTECKAVKTDSGDIALECQESHNGGMPQKFKLSIRELATDLELLSITSREPKFIIQEPDIEDIKFIIVAVNEKGESTPVEVHRFNIIDERKEDQTPKSAVANITTLSLALCGGVALIALAACGLVLCANERGSSKVNIPRDGSDPPLCAYNTEESNYTTFHDSDESEYNIRRTDSFKRAVSRYPSSKSYDVRRTGSFHSARYANIDQETARCNDVKYGSCRVHSLQNINRKRDMEAANDRVVPPDPVYHISKPMYTFHTMPKKSKIKSTRNIRDDNSETTQISDNYSLPPPPDEFSTYRAGARIRDIPLKTTPTYSTIRKSPKMPSKQSNTARMNDTNIPTISGPLMKNAYSYPDDPQDKRISSGKLTIQYSPFKKVSQI